MGTGTSLRQASKSGPGSEFCLRLASRRDAGGGRAFYREQLRLSAYVVRQIFAGRDSRYL